MMYKQTMRDALQEIEDNKHLSDNLDEPEQLDESLLGLLRTGAIALNTRNSVQSGKKIQQHARELKNIGNKLSTRKDPEDIQKEVADGFRTLSDLFLDMEEMMRRQVFLTASGSLFSDRAFNLCGRLREKEDNCGEIINITDNNLFFRRYK